MEPCYAADHGVVDGVQLDLCPRGPYGVVDLFICDNVHNQRAKAEPELEVFVSRLGRTRWYRVDIEIDEISMDWLGSDAGLLEDLAFHAGLEAFTGLHESCQNAEKTVRETAGTGQQEPVAPGNGHDDRR